ncbi:hypothetical protein [Paenibacillus sp. TC-CSREp1]|uniref:hypothetical protein n=1 Tax=Paenibacillus sp. TC-CSREp1 TaxID=3410089 RepID=UPI003CFA2285
MSTISFWSPFPATGCSSSTLIGAYALALQYRTRVLLVNTGLAGEGIEASLFKDEKLSSEVLFSFEENGLDAVERLFISGNLSKHNLRDYTKPLLKDRLDLLTGSQNRAERSAGFKGEMLKKLLHTANQCYDLILLDAPHDHVDTPLMLREADCVVAVLNQNMRNLETFFGQIMPDQLREKKVHVLINKYDSQSRATLSNIKRGFKYKGSLSAIPYTTSCLDAMNRRDAARYLQLEIQGDSKHARKGSFAAGLGELARLMMDGAEMRTVLKRLERGA